MISDKPEPLKALFDTSSFVVALFQPHPQHERALPWLERVIKKEIVGYISLHTLAEFYRTFTGAQLKIPPEITLAVIEQSILPHFQVIPLDEADYTFMLHELVNLKLAGAIIYDAIISSAAWKVQADFIVTFNKKHFDSINPNKTTRIIEP